jgi:DNA-binding response OmpR family regulator
MVLSGDVGAATVLVVDSLDSTRTVLETVLSRRGMKIVTASRQDEGLRLAREVRPDVIVLDSELPSALADESASGPFASASPENPPSLVLLGSARSIAATEGARYMQKPYLYAALVHTIEELVAERRAA